MISKKIKQSVNIVMCFLNMRLTNVTTVYIYFQINKSQGEGGSIGKDIFIHRNILLTLQAKHNYFFHKYRKHS